MEAYLPSSAQSQSFCAARNWMQDYEYRNLSSEIPWMTCFWNQENHNSIHSLFLLLACRGTWLVTQNKETNTFTVNSSNLKFNSNCSLFQINQKKKIIDERKRGDKNKQICIACPCACLSCLILTTFLWDWYYFLHLL